MRSLLRGCVVAALAVAPALLACRAEAFCGFYVGGADVKMFNDATVVVLMREGTRTVLSMQNSYKGPPEKFAMVVPVPVVLQKENVKTLDRKIFDHIDQLASPRLVEYWEQDPCAPEAPPSSVAFAPSPRATAPAPAARGAAEDLGVKIEAQFTVGEYQIVVLSAKDSGGLDTWLHREGYNIPEGGEPYFRPYVASGSKFFVAKVDIHKVKIEQGLAVLSPIRFHYDSEEFKLPVRLGLINSSGTQDLIVHILGRGTRYDVANYPNVTIPTNLDVSEVASERFGTFYTSLFDRTMEKNPKAVVTEYAWQPTSCDPCPGPVLDVSDLMTLGGDALPSSAPPSPLSVPLPRPPGKVGQPNSQTPRNCAVPYTIDSTGMKHYKPECLDGFDGPSSPPPPPPVRVFNPGFNDFVLTRLHVRYTKESLGEDLTFRAAPAIVGGRETRGVDGRLEHGATPSSSNNFQARYAVRHPWNGPITCKEPKRGVWGGKPGTGYATAPPKAAQKLGLAPRGAASDLATFAKADIPEIGFVAPVNAEVAAAAAAAAAAQKVPAPDVSAAATDAAASSGSANKGCLGCAVTHGDEPHGAWLAAIAALVVAARRARRGSR